MNVLSLFDGISGAQVALERAGIKVDNYFASEIDKYAIKITQKNYPKTIQLGSINDFDSWELPKIDLIIGGSPCQGFSFAGKQLNFEDPRSRLFFKFLECKKKFNPKWFLLENVRMKMESMDVITSNMGVEPLLINSELLSAQSRKRMYWFNWDINYPVQNGASFQDIKETSHDVLKKYKVNRTPSRELMYNSKCKNITNAIKTNCVVTKQDRGGNQGLVDFEDFCRYLTPIECERLQTFPDNYTQGISNTQRYKALGNSFTVDVITHILKGIKNA